MILVGASEKGGVGKSNTMQNYVTAFLQRRFLKKGDKEDSLIIPLYEFDSHNKSIAMIKNDPYVETKLVSGEKSGMAEAIAEIEYDSRREDIIIDVGGSDNLDRFLSLVDGKTIAKEMVFIIPEGKRDPQSAMNTIWQIREVVGEDAKILLALNRCIDESKKEEEFSYIYGNTRLGRKSSDLLKDKDISIATIPDADEILGFADDNKITLWSLGEEWRKYGKMSIDERENKWGIKAAKDAKKTLSDIEKKEVVCTREEYVKFTLALNVSELSMRTLDRCSDFFIALEKFDNA